MSNDEMITLNLDKEAAGYLVDLLYAQIGGRATVTGEPLGRVREALDELRFPDGLNGAEAFPRKYLVSLPTDQEYPNLARPDDAEAIRRSAQYR